MKSPACIAMLLSLAGIIFLAIGNVCDLYWWIGLISSSIGLIITFIESKKGDKRINDLESKQEATDRAFSISRDENFNVTEATIDGGGY